MTTAIPNLHGLQRVLLLHSNRDGDARPNWTSPINVSTRLYAPLSNACGVAVL
ncbi:MAG: hypothetical protein Q6370_014275 [Candidatus Sigynarchaeota archaeon]